VPGCLLIPHCVVQCRGARQITTAGALSDEPVFYGRWGFSVVPMVTTLGLRPLTHCVF
jgi:hypothetical protein